MLYIQFICIEMAVNEHNFNSMYDKKDVIDRYYHKMTNLNNSVDEQTVDMLLSKLGQDIGVLRILDIGCGLSPLLSIIRKKINKKIFISYTGIDSSFGMIKNASEINKSDDMTEIKYELLDVTNINTNIDLVWYNLIIVQSFVHLIFDKNDVIEICKYISKVISNNGLFYITTRTNVKIIECLYDDIFLVEKIEGCNYKRRVFTEQSFNDIIASTFINEGTYNLETFVRNDDIGGSYLVLLGIKDTLKLYQKYHYALGYNDKLKILCDLVNKYKNDAIEYVDSPKTMNTIRYEGLLSQMCQTNHSDFTFSMNVINEIFSHVMPNKFPVYMKDKLNMNAYGWKFQLHQDGSTGWKNIAHYNTFVTIGILMHHVRDIYSGPTRIGIRPNYVSDILPYTKSDNTIDKDEINKQIGKPIQYLNCLGEIGCYYVFDQYVIHDSNINWWIQQRGVFFVTCAVSDCNDDLYKTHLSDMFYKNKNKTILDKKMIASLKASGRTDDDFVIDSFGKILLKNVN